MGAPREQTTMDPEQLRRLQRALDNIETMVQRQQEAGEPIPDPAHLETLLEEFRDVDLPASFQETIRRLEEQIGQAGVGTATEMQRLAEQMSGEAQRFGEELRASLRANRAGRLGGAPLWTTTRTTTTTRRTTVPRPERRPPAPSEPTVPEGRHVVPPAAPPPRSNWERLRDPWPTTNDPTPTAPGNQTKKTS
jgi:hypothetical protein